MVAFIASHWWLWLAVGIVLFVVAILIGGLNYIRNGRFETGDETNAIKSRMNTLIALAVTAGALLGCWSLFIFSIFLNIAKLAHVNIPS